MNNSARRLSRDRASQRPPPPELPAPLSGGGGGLVVLNVAVTFFAAPILTVQVAVVPLQSPDHPPKLALLAVTAESTTVEFAVSAAEQVTPPMPQFMPPDDDV